MSEAFTISDPSKPETRPETLPSFAKALDDGLTLAEERRAGKERSIPFPAKWLDTGEQFAGGLWPGLHILVGGTGTGKTALVMQIALSAARAGVPVGYVGLELDSKQIALRVAGEHLGVPWSKVALGQDAAGIAAIKSKREELEKLPIYPFEGEPEGFPASRIKTIAETLRNAHPSKGPILLIVDFLQIIGNEPPRLGERAERLDLRERIGRAAYVARQVARDSGVAVLLVSSTSRANYDSEGETASKAKLDVAKDGRSIVLNPETLIGHGKESGEIEYAADTVSTLVRGPELPTCDGKERVVILVTAKNRYRGAGWTPFRFNGFSFSAWEHSRREVVEALKEKEPPRGKTKGKTEKEPPPSAPPSGPVRLDPSKYDV